MANSNLLNPQWHPASLIILGMTYPSYSNKHKEIACTGALIEHETDTGMSYEMIRLYPVPWRYIKPDRRFHAWQRIKAQIAPNTSDGRPESYRIDIDSIELHGKIESKSGAQRAQILRQSNRYFEAYADVLKANKENGVSLAIYQPASIEPTSFERLSREKLRAWEEKRALVLSQTDMFRSYLQQLDAPDYHFKVNWSDEEGKRHSMMLHDWGAQQLYRKLRSGGKPDPAARVATKIDEDLDLSRHAVFFFLGTLGSRKYTFTLMSALRVKREATLQGSLF